MDFTSTCWGHNFNIINSNDLDNISLVCWYTGINSHIEKNALFLSKGNKGGYFFGRIKGYEHFRDPDDMYSLTVSAIEDTDEMTKAEQEYLDKYIQESVRD